MVGGGCMRGQVVYLITDFFWKVLCMTMPKPKPKPKPMPSASTQEQREMQKCNQEQGKYWNAAGLFFWGIIICRYSQQPEVDSSQPEAARARGGGLHAAEREASLVFNSWISLSWIGRWKTLLGQMWQDVEWEPIQSTTNIGVWAYWTSSLHKSTPI